MKLKAMLSLDLDDSVDDAKRSKFYEELRKLQWTKKPRVTTVWVATFKDGVEHDDVVTTTESDVTKARTAAGIKASEIDAIVHVGPEAPTFVA